MGDAKTFGTSRADRPAVTVFGSSQPRPGSVAYERARTLGRLLARTGFDVVNGGYSGTMQAVSQGATELGGKAVGITCALFDGQRPGGNAYLTLEHHTPDLLARLRQLVAHGQAFAVLGGGVGTLLELLLVWNLSAISTPIGVRPAGIEPNKPCILVGTHWRRVLADLGRETEITPKHIDLLHIVDTPEEAVELLVTHFLDDSDRC
jgi:uncharacterized protein (TIGR00730 family)